MQINTFSTLYSQLTTPMTDHAFRFDYKLNIASDNGTYGRNPDEGDNWEGLMGDLVNDRADIGLASLHVTGVRQIDVDFTVPFYEFQVQSVALSLVQICALMHKKILFCSPLCHKDILKAVSLWHKKGGDSNI